MWEIINVKIILVPSTKQPNKNTDRNMHGTSLYSLFYTEMCKPHAAPFSLLLRRDFNCGNINQI